MQQLFLNMIFDKEYPATHSMSTAWYMVDVDGNVGLMAFDDNGPIPTFCNVPAESVLTELVFGQGFTDGDETCKGIHLNASQIAELLGNNSRIECVNDVFRWYEVCIAVAPDKVSMFLTLCQNEDFNNYGCVLPEKNLYLVDAFDCVDYNNDKIIEGSTLDTMLRENVIEAIYQFPELLTNSIYNQDTKSVEFTKDFDKAPYYIYCQSYWTRDMQHRMNVPDNPVMVSQIDEEYRDRLLYVPVRFKDAEDMQIAQWFVCSAYDDVIVIDNAGYSLFPVDKNKEKYCLTRPFLFDFFKYCPKRNHYNCTECDYDCARTDRFLNTLTPTVLYIGAPTHRRFDRSEIGLQKEIIEKMVAFSYIPKFPFKRARCWMDIEDVRELMTKESLISLLTESHGWFENVVTTINPRVIIIEDEAFEILSTAYTINNDEIKVGNALYPIFTSSSVREHIERIITLANASYRGKTFPLTYSVEEVAELKRHGKTFEVR